MPKRKIGADPTKRHPTRYRGITYRVRKDGSRQYSVYHGGRYVPVEGGENEALAKQADLRGKAARGEKAVEPNRLTFKEVAEEWFASKRHLRAWTAKNYRASLDRILIPRFGSKKIAGITAEDVAALIRDLERQTPKIAPTTITDYLKPLSGTMAHAMRRGYISRNPCALLTRDDRPRAQEPRAEHIWSDAEIDALVEAAEYLAKQSEARYDYTPLIKTALATGLRLGELLGLQWTDVDFAEKELHVRRQWTRLGEYAEPKTKAAYRHVPLSQDVAAYLREVKMASRFSGAEDPVFASKLGQPLAHRNATRRGFEKAAAHAGIDGVSFHSMRHAFASRMIDRGISSTVLAKIMGHESSTITERRYIHLFNRHRTDDLVREAMAR